MFSLARYFKAKDIEITMRAILAYKKITKEESIKADKILCKILNLRANKHNISLLQEEINSMGKIDIQELQMKSAAMALIPAYLDMTPAAIEMAHLGHEKLMCNLGNLYIVAIRKAFQEDAEPFSLDVGKKTKPTREETLAALGIKEE